MRLLSVCRQARAAGRLFPDERPGFAGWAERHIDLLPGFVRLPPGQAYAPIIDATSLLVRSQIQRFVDKPIDRLETHLRPSGGAPFGPTNCHQITLIPLECVATGPGQLDLGLLASKQRSVFRLQDRWRRDCGSGRGGFCGGR
jgi:hypothetical protein